MWEIFGANLYKFSISRLLHLSSGGINILHLHHALLFSLSCSLKAPATSSCFHLKVNTQRITPTFALINYFPAFCVEANFGVAFLAPPWRSFIAEETENINGINHGHLLCKAVPNWNSHPEFISLVSVTINFCIHRDCRSCIWQWSSSEFLTLHHSESIQAWFIMYAALYCVLYEFHMRTRNVHARCITEKDEQVKYCRVVHTERMFSCYRELHYVQTILFFFIICSLL